MSVAIESHHSENASGFANNLEKPYRPCDNRLGSSNLLTNLRDLKMTL